MKRQANLALARVPTSAVCAGPATQLSAGRLARHDVSDPSPICSAGAQDGTVRPMYWPFLTGSDRSSGNWTIVPK